MGLSLPLLGDIFSLFAALLLAMLGAMALMVLATIFFGRLTYRRVRADARVNRTALSVRTTFTPPGPQRTLIRLRLRLAEATLAGNDALSILRTHGAVQGEMAQLVRQVNQAAATLDAQLRLMQQEPDARRVREAIEPLGARVAAVEGIIGQVREAAYLVLDGDGAETTAALTGAVAREVSALGAGVAALHGVTAEPRITAPLRVQRKESYQ